MSAKDLRMRLRAYASRPMGGLEFFLWWLLAAVLFVVRLAVAGGPTLGPDSYQYLSAADNFAQGRPGYTSIVHFDTERSHGTVPAPMTTFPPGYSAGVAALSATGLSPETSAATLSVAALLALLLVYRAMGAALGLGGPAMRVLLVLTLANAEVHTYATAVFSEALFTVLSASALFLVATGIGGEEARFPWLRLVAGGALLGLAYWVRYAGLFLFVAMVAYAVFLLLRRGRKAAARAGVALAVAGGFIALGFLRNYHLVGTWKGGNDKHVSHPLLGVAARAPIEIYHMFTGSIGSAHYGLADLLVIASFGLVLALCLKGAFAHGRARDVRVETLLEASGFFLVIYAAAMVYAGHSTVISYGPRMFFPLLPILLVLFALAITRRLERRTGALMSSALVVLCCAYGYVNLRSLRSEPHVQPQHERVLQALAEPVAPGLPLRAWLAAHLGPDDVIVATHGQATGYVLKHPTVSLVPAEYSRTTWGEAEVKALMVEFHARYLFVYPGDEPSLFRSPFLADLAAGTHPAWLDPAAEGADLRIFRREP